MWTAAAAAREWTAAAHSRAVCALNRNAGEAAAEAAAAGLDAATAGYNAVGSDGRLDSAALVDAAARLRTAARAHHRAGAVFGRAAVQAGASAVELDMAADARAKAGDGAGERALRGRADAARAVMRDAGGRVPLAGKAAKSALAASRRWAEVAAGRPDGAAWPGGRAAWTGAQEGLRADAERERARWSDGAGRAAAEAQAADSYLHRCTAAADKATTAAEDAGVPAGTPEEQEALAAWRGAIAAARKAANVYR